MSQRASGEERKTLDQYMTPPWVVEALLFKERLFGPVWEPAQGEGAIVRTICERATAAAVIGSDIDPHYNQSTDGWDFLIDASSQMSPKQWPWTIITNPPYGKSGQLARSFVEHALKITEAVSGKVIMLLPNEWDSAPRRQHLFENFPGYVAKYTLTRRIRWTNLPQKKNGPSQNHAWFVWDHARRGRDMGWIA